MELSAEDLMKASEASDNVQSANALHIQSFVETVQRLETAGKTQLAKGLHSWKHGKFDELHTACCAGEQVCKSLVH